MRRLPPHSLAGEWLARGALDLTHLRRLALRLEAFHRAAPVAPFDAGYASFERIRGDALQAVDALARLLPTGPGAAGCATLRCWFEERSAALAPRFAARLAAGRVREGHGDLHLDNVLVLGRDITAFDCIEFDPALRWIDVMNDVGFLVMDLLAHRRRDLAFGFLDAYLEAGGDFDGLDVLRLYLVYRAVVRALVSALRDRERVSATGLHADEYLQLALRLAAPGDPRLLLTHGLPGAGKTHLTQQLLERAGAIRIRSDVERKRLAGLAAEARSSTTVDLYTPERNAATYDRLADLARASLRAGYPTIVDAAFLRKPERDRLRAVANELGLPCALLDCRAPLATLRERVRTRSALGQDASEADLTVLERLAAVREPLTAEERTRTLEVRTDRPLSLAALLARWLERGGSGGDRCNPIEA
jgi:predicted kinase